MKSAKSYMKTPEFLPSDMLLKTDCSTLRLSVRNAKKMDHVEKKKVEHELNMQLTLEHVSSTILRAKIRLYI